MEKDIFPHGSLVELVKGIVLPYRALTKSERDQYNNLARGLGYGKLADDLIWKTTRPAGLDVVRKISSWGYDVSKPSEWGNPIDGYGETVKVSSRNEHFDIGIVELWECPGFTSDPVTVFLDDYEQGLQVDYEESIEFSKKLSAAGIKFEFSPNPRDLQEKLWNLDCAQRRIRDCLDAIKKAYPSLLPN